MQFLMTLSNIISFLLANFFFFGPLDATPILDHAVHVYPPAHVVQHLRASLEHAVLALLILHVPARLARLGLADLLALGLVEAQVVGRRRSPFQSALLLVRQVVDVTLLLLLRSVTLVVFITAMVILVTVGATLLELGLRQGGDGGHQGQRDQDMLVIEIPVDFYLLVKDLS